MRNLIASATLVAGLMMGSAALAAPPQAGTNGPLVVTHEVAGRTMIGAPIDQVTVSQPVSYADLNLANPADVKILDRRIRATARQDCADLRDIDPNGLYPTISGGNCVRSAEHDARASLKETVVAANDLR